MWLRGTYRWPKREADAVRTVACRDDYGRERPLLIALHGDRVLLGKPGGGQWWLSPSQAGRLRAALRDVVARDVRR